MTLNPEYCECPFCNTLTTHLNVMSYSLHNVESWSDGKVMDSNFNEYSNLLFTKCRNCNELFWYSETKKISDIELTRFRTTAEGNNAAQSFLAKHSDLLNATENIPVNSYPFDEHWFAMPDYFIRDLQKMLDNNSCNTLEKETYIRIKLWQHINDLVRFRKNTIFQHIKHSDGIKSLFNFSILKKERATQKHKKALYLSLSEMRINNLTRLCQIFEQNSSDIDNKRMLIELYRELKQFDKAQNCLKSIPSDNTFYLLFFSKTKLYLMQKSARVFKV